MAEQNNTGTSIKNVQNAVFYAEFAAVVREQ